MKKFFKFLISIPKFIALFFIAIFKFCISPFIPHACKFSPTCSIYAGQAFAEWGFFKGFGLTVKRLSKCHSKAIGGTDEVPLNPKKKYKYFM
ncbi:MAG: membrane protein insertion efficiency factor YidD [Clostridia bacterium]|nr:membrane protein insertion efficiency factor YidD [Clostridia bacterium]